jgi:hypothetical protein
MILSTQPLWLIGILLILPTTFIAMAGPLIIRNFVTLDQLRANNEVAGFKFATVGVFYAVLLGFAVIVVWEKFNDAESAVAQEASAAATIYRLAEGVEGEPAAALHQALAAYLEAAVTKDWPAMEVGDKSPEATRALSDAYSAILKYRPSDGHDSVVMAEILRQLDLVTQARRSRLVMASGVVPRILWMVLFGGAVLTIGFTFFFGASNVLAQMIMTGILSILILSGITTVVAIDHPFAGAARVRPEPLAAVLQDFGGVTLPQ